MINQDSIKFLRTLRDNNSKEWFDANRKWYEQVRKNFISFNETLIHGIEVFDEEIALSQLEPRKTMMRINRDIRFSKDKTPYNSHLFTYINKGGKKNPSAGYFFSLDPGQSFYGAGCYKPPSEMLARVRQEIDYNQQEWLNIAENSSIRAVFDGVNSSDRLVRPPKGYDKEHPLVDWLKRKDFYVQRFISDEEMLNENLVERILQDLKVSLPLVKFVNRN